MVKSLLFCWGPGKRAEHRLSGTNWLTGSSARKLRGQGVNLLGGRARQHIMHPFSMIELGDRFDLLRTLNHGLLPSVYESESSAHDLADYVGLYFKEEIVAEAIVKSPQFGEAFESYIPHELRTYIDYTTPRSLHYWRGTSNFEVDCIYDNRIGIEAKGKEQLTGRDTAGLRALREEDLLERYLVVSLSPVRKTLEGGTEVWPWQDFVTELWQGGFG